MGTRSSSLTSLTRRCKSSYSYSGGALRRCGSLTSLIRSTGKTMPENRDYECPVQAVDKKPENFPELFQLEPHNIDEWMMAEQGITFRPLLSTLSSVDDHEECQGAYCNFAINLLQNPDAVIHSFVVYFCEQRGLDAFYDLCSAFDIPDDDCVKIQDANASLKLQCFDVLHRVYHRHNEQLTLAMIKTTLSEHSDQLRLIISGAVE